MFIHRLLKPIVVELLKFPADIECLFPTVVMVAVQHQRHIVADRLSHGGTRHDIHLGVGGPRNGWHPGVQLNRLVAALYAPLGERA